MRSFLAPLMLAAFALAGCLPQWPKPATYPALTVTAGEPLLAVLLVENNGTAVMKRVGRNGSTESWMAQDRNGLTLDRGILVATRGLGFDLMGSDATPVLAALQSGATEVYSRKMRYMTGDNRSVWINAGCSITARTSDTLQGVKYTRFEENCRTNRERYTNLYWLDGQGRIRVSRQWISPQVGQMVIQAQN